MVPTFNKTNNLITQVASVLNLELDGDSDASADADYSMKDLEDTPVTFDSQQTINLKTGADGSQHYAMISGYTISVNKKQMIIKTLEQMQLQLSHLYIQILYVL